MSCSPLPSLVGETHFFRQSAQFDDLLERVLPPLLEHSKVRIWSAGCSSGAEPYSLVLALAERWPHLLAQGAFEILASDVNPEALEQSRAGRFGPWQLRGCPAEMQDRYFQAGELHADLRRHVHFFQGDLRWESGPANCHVIFCRNLLIYYGEDDCLRMLSHLHRSLLSQGRLYLGHAEAVKVLHLFPQLKLESGKYSVFVHQDQPLSAPRPVLKPTPAPESFFSAGPGLPRPRRRPPAPVAAPEPVENPDEALEALAQAEFWLERDNPDQARECLRRCLYLQPELAVAHYRLGMLDWSLGRERSARASWRHVLELAAAAPADQEVPGWSGTRWSDLAAQTRAILRRLRIPK